VCSIWYKLPGLIERLLLLLWRRQLPLYLAVSVH
jgi:hypothetical protein